MRKCKILFFGGHGLIIFKYFYLSYRYFLIFGGSKLSRVIQTKCGEYPGILRGILSVPHNIIMNLNNVRLATIRIIIK